MSGRDAGLKIWVLEDIDRAVGEAAGFAFAAHVRGVETEAVEEFVAVEERVFKTGEPLVGQLIEFFALSGESEISCLRLLGWVGESCR